MSFTLTFDSQYQFSNYTEDCIEIGATKALVEAGIIQENISQAEAWRRFKRAKVEAWIKEGLIEPIKNGLPGTKAGVEFNLVRLKILNRESRHSYITKLK